MAKRHLSGIAVALIAIHGHLSRCPLYIFSLRLEFFREDRVTHRRSTIFILNNLKTLLSQESDAFRTNTAGEILRGKRFARQKRRCNSGNGF